MKCTTAQTPNGALEGTPFPPIWLKRFSELAPISVFNTMSRVCKRIHQHMRLNVVWKKKAKQLQEYETLTQFERKQLRNELFWYEWWCDRVIRVIPVRPYPHNGSLASARPGNLCIKGGDPNDPNCKILIIMSDIIMPVGNRKGGFSYVDALEPLSKILQSNTVSFKIISKYNVVIRTNGNLSVYINLIP